MKRILVFAVFLLAGAGAKEPLVCFLAEQAPERDVEVVMVAKEQRSKSFPLPGNALSNPLAVPARSFVLRAADGDAALAEVGLPAAGKSFVILLIPAAGKGYLPVVLDSDDPAFKPGDLYFHNSSDKAIRGKVGTTAFTLEPGKGGFIRPEGATPDKGYDVSFHVREVTGDRLLSETRWPVDGRMRSYVFFFRKPATGRVDYRAVDEFVAEPSRP